MRTKPGEAHRRAGAAARLAGELLEWSEAGLSRRAVGRCGVPDGAEARHRARGHDAGCAAIGVPRHELARMIERADTVGATKLLLDAVNEAIIDLASRGAGWRLDTARELLGEAVERRITPAVKRPAAEGPGPAGAMPADNRVTEPVAAEERPRNTKEGPRPSGMTDATPQGRHG